MNFLKELLSRLKAVSELDEGEIRDVVLNTVDIISYTGKIEPYETFNKELYEALSKELKVDIEKKGIKNIQTELDCKKYEFEINRMKINLNTVRERLAIIEGDTYKLTYTYEEYSGTKTINNMIVCVM